MRSNIHQLNLIAMNNFQELRKRLIYYSIVLVISIAGLWSHSQQIYTLFSTPLLKVLPEGHHMLATSITAPFIIPLKLTCIAAFFITLPWMLYQIWAFISPGLYPHEKRMVWPFMLACIALFFAGAAFAYFIAFPLIFNFFASLTPVGVDFAPDISQFYSFALRMLMAFGLAFELPVIVWLVVYFGLVKKQTLSKQRPYVIVAAFTAGMLLTPPDIFSQILLAVPICLLFELGLFFAPRHSNHHY